MTVPVKNNITGFSVLTIVLVSVFFPLCPAYAKKNLVKNSSFENTAAKAGLENWEIPEQCNDPGNAEIHIDTETVRTGKTSLFISNHVSGYYFLAQTVPVEELSVYKLSAWIRTDNVGDEGSGACISIQDGIHEQNRWTLAGDFRGTLSDWQYAEMYAVTGKGVKSLAVVLSVGFQCYYNSGAAWFDDISLEKVRSLPEFAEAVTINPVTERIQDANLVAHIDIQERPVRRIALFIVIGSIMIVISSLFCSFLLRFEKHMKNTGQKPV